MKTCQRCKVSKQETLFCKNSRKIDGLNTWCIDCTKEYKKLYYDKNKEKLLDGFKEKYLQKSEEIKAAQKRRYWADPDKHRLAAIEYQKKNRDSVLARHREWSKAKRQNDVQYKLRVNLRRRLNRAVTGRVKKTSAVDDLGCSIEFLVSWLEAKFHSGMKWENYGAFWHIDHIVPLSCFDLEVKEQSLKACHYTNLQPMLASENIRKGGKNRKEFK